MQINVKVSQRNFTLLRFARIGVYAPLQTLWRYCVPAFGTKIPGQQQLYSLLYVRISM